MAGPILTDLWRLKARRSHYKLDLWGSADDPTFTYSGGGQTISTYCIPLTGH